MSKKYNKKTVNEFISSLIYAVVIAVLFRSLLFEPFYIPSGSMKSTLLIGDYVFVSKYSYGYSRYSFPFGLNIFSGRLWYTPPRRGDVVVFKLPTDPDVNYIKRLIGLPGDRIQVINGQLILNGQKMPRQRVENFVDEDEKGNRYEIPQYVETLPNGVSYHVLDQVSYGQLDNTWEYQVPEGHYFMMGDNRDNSQDSRVLSLVGYVPEENILGPARMIFFSSKYPLWQFWRWFEGVRGKRFLESLSGMVS